MLPPLDRWPQRALIALVRGYRLLLSPWLGSACRFEPTCSAYALHAFEKHGASAGTYFTLRRLGRCHPFCAGGYDPVPDRAPALFTRFTKMPPRATSRLSSTPIDKTSP